MTGGWSKFWASRCRPARSLGRTTAVRPAWSSPACGLRQARGEALHPRLIVLDKHPPQSLVIHVRPLGGDNWQAVSVTHTARAVYQATLPAAQDDFEYFAEATLADGRKLVWPATAPQLCQTVVIQP